MLHLENVLRQRPDPDSRQQLLLRAQPDDRVRHLLSGGQSTQSQDRPMPDDRKVTQDMCPGLYQDARRLLLPQRSGQPGRKNLRVGTGRTADHSRSVGHSHSGHCGLRSQHAQGSEKRHVRGGSAAGRVPPAEPDGQRPMLFAPRDCRGTMRTEASATDMRAQSNTAGKYLRGYHWASNFASLYPQANFSPLDPQASAPGPQANSSSLDPQVREVRRGEESVVVGRPSPGE